MIGRARALLVPALAAASLVLLPAAPAGADDTLLATDSPAVVVAVPPPGHDRAWQLSAENVSENPVAVSALVTGVDGEVFDGAHPLTVSVSSPDRTELALPAENASGATTRLATLQPGEKVVVSGVASLPQAAGDEYQGLSGRMTIRLVGEDLGGPPSGSLATTGAESLTAAVIAAALLGSGLLFVLARRRRRTSDDPATATPSTLDIT